MKEKAKITSGSAADAAAFPPSPSSRLSSASKASKASKACEDMLEEIEREYMEVAGGSRSILDDHGMLAYFDVYRTMVSRRPDVESSSQGSFHQSQQSWMERSQGAFRRSNGDWQEQILAESTEDNQHQGDALESHLARPAAADAAKNVNTYSTLAPGLMSWKSPQNPWHWPRKGGMPSMEASVVALLHGKPPPKSVSKKAAEEARRELLLPVVERVREVARWQDQGQEIKVRKPKMKMRAGLRCR